jgi:hypothetical protein
MTGFLDASVIEEGGGYQIQRSLRTRASATAYLSRTFGVPTDAKKYTISVWCKRGALSSLQGLISAFDGALSHPGEITFNANDTVTAKAGGSAVNGVTTTAVYRDPSAHMHICFSIDAANTTCSLFVNNGPALTATIANVVSQLNANGRVVRIGAFYTAAAQFLDGYLSEFNFIDGQALTPSSFGQTDPTTGQWSAKKYVGTYGTNGFYLDFSDPTSATTLCYDRSGNGNNWTPNNISTTAGATYDSMLDVPLGGGGAERGNYCTLNPLDKITTTVTNGNLTANPSGMGPVLGTIQIPASGKIYAECTADTTGASGTSLAIFGVKKTSAPLVGGNAAPPNVWGVSWDGRLIFSLNATQTIGASGFGVIGRVFQFAIDTATGSIWLGTNNVWYSAVGTVTSAPDAGGTPAATGLPADLIPFFSADLATASVNFGQRGFTYTPPAGFKALHTGNLPIPVGAALEPKKHFDVVTYLGNGGAKAITGLGFQPDLVWPKDRGVALNHRLVDSVRGTTKVLSSNTTDAERTIPDANDTFTSFDSGGFTLGAGQGMNSNGDSYVAWLWKAGGAAVTNTTGTITSQVSANVAAGFSVLTYTGTGANATVAHGLGVAPKMMIVKQRSATGDWFVYHANSNATPQNAALFLNLTTAYTNNVYWNNTAPTSSVFTTGVAGGLNASGVTQVAYCFAEVAGYSKIGSYTGNGSADGPMVWCGFRPRFVMYKRADSVSDWQMVDTARDPYNPQHLELNANLSGVEFDNTGVRPFDLVANGFKIRGTNGGANASGGTYIFYAISEANFKYALGR